MRAKQRLGQNFLMHRATAERIVKAASLPPHSRVLEIGPGTGILTRALLSAEHDVTAVETDTELLSALGEEFGSNKHFKLVHADFRSFDLTALKKPYFVVANIPYYITGDIIRILLSAKNKPLSVTLLVQKEVAVRIVRSKKESILSLSVKVYGSPRVCFSVPRGSFRPAPKVDSAVLHIGDIKNPFRGSAEEKKFFDLIHAGFAHKRKLLGKNLEAVSPTSEVQSALATLGIPLTVRAEDLPLESWKKLAQMLK